ncbi:hypothetical protein W911_00235 [Hyphomicrobium nitrativorans NL23]|uniref:Uncharacterized protein n=1 Tax=Hyphomicrobium nitrativorans NL23 TaxID=1029756 RepID=V5S8U4_9HYPH|nr:hypothetical protein W911_00235 [Hyphomicrobium nitrativorans NL23]
MDLIIGWVLLSIAVGVGARNRFNRSGADWCVLSLVVSPLIAGAFLLAAGPKIAKAKRPLRGLKNCPPPLPTDDLDAAIRGLRA